MEKPGAEMAAPPWVAPLPLVQSVVAALLCTFQPPLIVAVAGGAGRGGGAGRAAAGRGGGGACGVRGARGGADGGRLMR